jgi:hypothetical protein
LFSAHRRVYGRFGAVDLPDGTMRPEAIAHPVLQARLSHLGSLDLLNKSSGYVLGYILGLKASGGRLYRLKRGSATANAATIDALSQAAVQGDRLCAGCRRAALIVRS